MTGAPLYTVTIADLEVLRRDAIVRLEEKSRRRGSVPLPFEKSISRIAALDAEIARRRTLDDGVA